MSLGERKTSQEAPVHPLPPMPSILCLLSLPPPSLRLPLALQYQIGGEAQVDSSQQSYKDEVGRVGKAGQVGDHEVEVDGTDQRHDGGCDGLAQPGGQEGGSGLPGSPPSLHCPKPAWRRAKGHAKPPSLGCGTWSRPLAHFCLLGPPGSTRAGCGKRRV